MFHESNQQWEWRGADSFSVSHRQKKHTTMKKPTTMKKAHIFICRVLIYIYYAVLLRLPLVTSRLVQAYQYQRSQCSHTRPSCPILEVACNATGVKTFPLSFLFLICLCRQRHLQSSLHLTAIFETKGVFVWHLTAFQKITLASCL